jgi:hypothetical protein
MLITIHQEGITIINLYASQIGAPKLIKEAQLYLLSPNKIKVGGCYAHSVCVSTYLYQKKKKSKKKL